MASTNQSPQYQAAEAKFVAATTDEQKIVCLKEMLRLCPKHKSSEKMLANLKTRYVKLKAKIEKQKKARKSKKGKGIKKSEMQAILVGLTNSGKSSILLTLTNTNPKITPHQYTTKSPLVGMMNFEASQVQIIDMPAIESEFFNQGLLNTADLLLIIITKIQDLEKINLFLKNSIGKKLIIFNKSDLLSESEKRKIQETLKSKKLNFFLFSAKSKENVGELKEKIFRQFDIIRIYTKQPGKPSIKETPLILEPNATIKEVAEKIYKGLSKNIKEIRIWGPSSKFPNQRVGLTHKLKDKDIIEFHEK